MANLIYTVVLGVILCNAVADAQRRAIGRRVTVAPAVEEDYSDVPHQQVYQSQRNYAPTPHSLSVRQKNVRVQEKSVEAIKRAYEQREKVLAQREIALDARDADLNDRVRSLDSKDADIDRRLKEREGRLAERERKLSVQEASNLAKAQLREQEIEKLARERETGAVQRERALEEREITVAKRERLIEDRAIRGGRRNPTSQQQQVRQHVQQVVFEPEKQPERQYLQETEPTLIRNRGVARRQRVRVTSA